MTTSVRRFFRPAVELGTGDGTIKNLDGDGLRFSWRVRRDNTPKADEGQISIWNLSPSLRGSIYESWAALSGASGYLVTFSLGWDGNPELVISGDVWDLIPDRRTPTDVETIFSLGDGNQALRDSTLTKNFADIKISALLDWILKLPADSSDAGGGGLGLIFPKESRDLVDQAVAETSLQTLSVPPGSSTRDSVDLIMETIGLEWRVSNGEFIALRGGIVNRPGEILRPGTGLISFERRSDSGVSLTGLANPRIVPGLQIQVQDDAGEPFAEPLYRVESVDFRGDSDGQSLMQVEGRRSI